MTVNKWLMKVRALLTKAEDPAATPEEAEALTAKATELMAKYGIDRALADARSATKQTPADRIFDFPGAYARERSNLLGWIGQELGCHAVTMIYRSGRRITNFKVHMFGFQSDLDRMELLYTSLLVQMANGLAKAEKPLGEDTAAFNRSWMTGFATAATNRIGEAEQRAKANAGGDSCVALVLADRSKQVEAAKAARYPVVEPPPKRRLSGSGRQAGALAGQLADIGSARIETNTSTTNALTSA